jgi:hypothetical protein
MDYTADSDLTGDRPGLLSERATHLTGDIPDLLSERAPHRANTANFRKKNNI